jgi:hypothetical protein
MATVNSRVTLVDIDGMTAAAATTAVNAAVEVLEAAGFVVVSVDFEVGSRGGLPIQLVAVTGLLPAYAGEAAGLGLTKVAILDVGHADLTAAATSESISFADALPEGSYPVGVRIGLSEAFSGGSVSALVADVGLPGDPDAMVDGADLFTAAVDGEASDHPLGIAPNKLVTGDAAARTPEVLFTATGDNVVNLDAGACRVALLYV